MEFQAAEEARTKKMGYQAAVKIWNSHRKRIDPTHVYALPRKGTPEHAMVKFIQSGQYKIVNDAIVKVRESVASTPAKNEAAKALRDSIQERIEKRKDDTRRLTELRDAIKRIRDEGRARKAESAALIDAIDARIAAKKSKQERDAEQTRAIEANPATPYKLEGKTFDEKLQHFMDIHPRAGALQDLYRAYIGPAVGTTADIVKRGTGSIGAIMVEVSKEKQAPIVVLARLHSVLNLLRVGMVQPFERQAERTVYDTEEIKHSALYDYVTVRDEWYDRFPPTTEKPNTQFRISRLAYGGLTTNTNEMITGWAKGKLGFPIEGGVYSRGGGMRKEVLSFEWKFPDTSLRTAKDKQEYERRKNALKELCKVSLDDLEKKWADGRFNTLLERARKRQRELEAATAAIRSAYTFQKTKEKALQNPIPLTEEALTDAMTAFFGAGKDAKVRQAVQKILREGRNREKTTVAIYVPRGKNMYVIWEGP